MKIGDLIVNLIGNPEIKYELTEILSEEKSKSKLENGILQIGKFKLVE